MPRSDFEAIEEAARCNLRTLSAEIFYRLRRDIERERAATHLPADPETKSAT